MLVGLSRQCKHIIATSLYCKVYLINFIMSFPSYKCTNYVFQGFQVFYFQPQHKINEATILLLLLQCFVKHVHAYNHKFNLIRYNFLSFLCFADKQDRQTIFVFDVAYSLWMVNHTLKKYETELHRNNNQIINAIIL